MFAASFLCGSLLVNTFKLAAFAAVVLCVSLVVRGQSTIVGGSHDFSAWPSTGADDYSNSGQICKPCHTPHNATSTSVSDRLWNHTLSTVSYKLHTISSSSAGGVTELDRQSRLCLGCHDGTVALDSFGGAINPTGGKMVGKANFKADLSNDHRLGIEAVFDANNPDPALHTLDEVQAKLPLATMGTGDQLKWVVSCMTCHDPHMSQSKMLRIDNTGSALCFTCHHT
jgi:predicted CXXCH cytochrome family protein